MNKMKPNRTPDKALSNVSESVDGLYNTSRQLFLIMEEQVQAIIAADAKRVEKLAEEHADLQGRFRFYENALRNEVRALSAPENEGEPKSGFDELKKRYPESAGKIEEWKALLTENTQRLQKKHKQVVELLDFALERNARMMHSIYSMHNNKNTHYSPTGGKEGVLSGVAVNHEA